MLVNLDYKEVTIDDGISFKMKPLSSKATQKVMKFLQPLLLSGHSKPGEKLDESEAMKTGLDQLTNDSLVEISEYIFKEHVVELKGFTIQEDGKERDPKIEDLYSHGVLLKYCLQILIRVFNESSLSIEENKELKK